MCNYGPDQMYSFSVIRTDKTDSGDYSTLFLGAAGALEVEG